MNKITNLILIISLIGCGDMREVTLKQVFEEVRDGNILAVENILKDGFDPNVVNEKGTSLLEVPLTHNNLEMFNMLLNYGADPNFRANDKKMPLLISAVSPTKLSFVERLIENGATIDQVHEPYGTAFEQALTLKQFHIANYLVEKGANPIVGFDSVDRLKELVCVKLIYNVNNVIEDQAALVSFLVENVDSFEGCPNQ